jgi:hypothetical protein
MHIRGRSVLNGNDDYDFMKGTFCAPDKRGFLLMERE